MSIADRIARGESEENARQAAMREFGNVPLVEDVTREMWGWVWLEHLAQNLRYAARRLRRSPGFAVAAVTIIAVGIAVTTAIYSVVYAVVLQPLPFAQPNQLVAVSAKPQPVLSLPTLQDWQRGSHAFQSIAAYGGWSPRIESSAGLGHVNAELVSQNFAGTLGLDFALGHDFTKTGNESDCMGQAIVSYSYWRRMGGSGALANRTIQLDYRTYAIVGVLSPDVALQELEALGEPSILTPIGCDPSKSPQNRGDFDFGAIGRLYPGVSLQGAIAELQTRQWVLSRKFPQDYAATFTPVLVPLADYISGTNTRSALFATLAACGMLLLIACANLVNLLLARNMRRRSEFALRATLGARPRHLAGQVLAENCLLSTTGAVIGIALSVVLVRAVTHLSVIHLPRLAHAKVNLPVLGFAGSLTVLIAFLLTLLPALRSLRPALLADLTYGGFRSSSVSLGLRRAGRFLVAAQLAMAFVLVASSGWMVSSVFILLHQPLGFEPDHLLMARTDLRGHTRNATRAPAKILAVLDQTLADVRVLPGVAEVAAANDKPLGGRVNRYNFCADAHPDDCKQPSLMAPDVFQVTPGYFHTVRQQIYRGRLFNNGDDGRSHVAIVNRALAAEQWPGQDPIGHRIYTGDLRAWATVVGEVGDVHSYSLERAPVPNLYLPEADGPDTSMTIFVRTDGDPSQMDETIRRVVRSDNEIELRYVESMPELMAHQVAVRRFSMWVIAAFGALALAIAILGTYALLAYEVSVREREIGIRLALGSSRPAIVSLLIGQESPWVAAGMMLGLFGAVLAGFLLRAEFYHAQAASIPVLLTSSILLALPALTAIAIPGRRASLLDPSVTLRQE
jgi:putative ABC transport system permease protein